MTGGPHHHEHQHGAPPSAAGHLEPFSARVTLRATVAGFAPQPFLVALLEALAVACAAEGATVIGHLKCLLHLPGQTLACNLTSVRGGARCRERDVETAPLLVGEAVRLDLAVLVYGVDAEKIESLVHAELSRLLDPPGVVWAL